MEPKWDKGLGVVFVLLQVLCGGSVESTPCSPGFASDLFLLRVHREHLHKGSRIGTVVFNDCGGRTQTTFDSADARFHVNSDGTVDLKTPVTLHDGHKMFSVHAWDSRGKKHTAFVRVEHQGRVGHHHGQQEEDWAVEPVQTESPSALLVLEFPKSGGLRRRKREWVIPPISIAENSKGPFPFKVVQIKSSYAKETRMVYSISGEGANQPPLGLFTVDKTTGELYVSRPLDREEKDKYELQALAKSPTDPTIEEPPMEFIVVVTDQNDNHPIFTQNPFIGSVPEASKIGFEFMTVTATDADDPDTYNADVRYSIISQIPTNPSPNMFAISPITGAIRVNADGLDREANPEYTLEIQAADMQGEGRPVSGIAIITVTDSYNNAPQFLKNLTEVEWVIPPIRITENAKGPFPLVIAQIKSSYAKETKLVYSITGEGSDRPPVGLFTIDRNTGVLYVSRPLDREIKDKYELQVHAHSVTDDIKEPAIKVIVEVLDQNDNSPVFTQNPFIGSVPEASKIGYEFLTITATDADNPNTDNADIRYSIISQIPAEPHPNIFEINPVSGVIRVNADGLDREKYPEYTLEIQASDMQGFGLRVTGKATITVTDSSDKSPTEVEWVIPPIRITENAKGPFPLMIAQIKSSYAKETKLVYSITGEGSDRPPVGLFTIDRNTGVLYVSRPLDREIKDKYELQVHAHSVTDDIKKPAIKVIVEVLDQNDNSPVFTQNPFIGSVPEASKIGYEFLTITATDADNPNTDNADIRYSIVSQIPAEPHPNIFEINPVSGVIRVNADGLDREKYPEYTLEIQASDMQGFGLRVTGKATITVTDRNDESPANPEYTLEIQAADMQGDGRRVSGIAIITVTDSNDNAPQFLKNLYNVSVPEDKVGAVVVKMSVTDNDEPQSSAWAAKFKIVSGNSGGLFNISTGPNRQEGIITTVKPLDFENNNKYTLLVAVENDVPFAKPLPTSTATVIVNVIDLNEAPVFDPVEKFISKPEDAAIDSELTVYTATDPDTGKSQKVTYRIGSDPAGWLKIVNPDIGRITVKSPLDRESPYVKDGKYRALILAVDNDDLPATGTGTLVIELQDVNDNGPIIEERTFKICNKDSSPLFLSVTDKDGPGFGAPFSVLLQGDGKNNWTAKMNDTKTGIILQLKTPLEQEEYNVILRVFDNSQVFQDNTVLVSVCDCTGGEASCAGKSVAGFGLSGVLGILGAILALLLLVLLLLLFLRRKGTKKEQPLINDDDIRDNVYYYDEEGGGEDDQDYDLSVLHRGLDNRPDVFRNDVVPTFMPAPQYRPRPANPEEIGTFIDDNLKAADNDPTAPPYDSLLVFDYEGGGSEAGSLSSLNSSSSGDQDYDRLNEWGPRFKKLADMYGGGEDD
ncbi:B-cadherin isoform X2 [Ictalurus punctatus]|uniref:Cadherin-1 n=1 Tax=Ictalurus punctatus TaxID=7998 RepID=A0A9F7R9K1_ICTPU|nr:B-cadherin isoform X2 [Ictalurus punctatus]